VHFSVNVSDQITGNWIGEQTKGPYAVFAGNISPIDLGAVVFNIITLDGHIDFKINGATPSNMRLELRSSSGPGGYGDLGGTRINSTTGNWSITMNALASSTTVYFYVLVNDNGRTYDTGQWRTVHQLSISDIELGQVYKTTITLSGTVSGTVDGGSPDGYMLAAYIAGENTVIGNTNVAPSGDWSMEVEPLASSNIVSFIAASVVGNSVIFTRLPSTYDKPFYNTSVSGINLTGLAITTKTIQFNITSNGTTAVPGYMYVCHSPIVPADIMSGGDAMWLKVITVPMGEDSSDPGDDGGGSIPSSWTLKVPSDTSSVYFFVMTASGEYYASTAPTSVSGTPIPVTLDLSSSDMTQFQF
jgi:hypothetical protein